MGTLTGVVAVVGSKIEAYSPVGPAFFLQMAVLPTFLL